MAAQFLKGEYVYVDLENIYINDICDTYTVIVTNNETQESFSVVYSVASYIGDALGKSDTNIKLSALLRSLFAYYKAAIEYENSEK